MSLKSRQHQTAVLDIYLLSKLGIRIDDLSIFVYVIALINANYVPLRGKFTPIFIFLNWNLATVAKNQKLNLVYYIILLKLYVYIG